MKKSHTPSFILELPLKTTSSDESIILKRLDIGRQIYNACLGECIKRLDLMRQSKEFQIARKMPKEKKGSDIQIARNEAFNDLNGKFVFTEYDISQYATKVRGIWIGYHINSQLSQKISQRAFKAVQKKAFGIARRVRFKSKNQFDTIEGKNNKQGLIFRDNVLHWGGLEISCIIDEKNEYQKYGLGHRVKYCRLVRRKIGSKNRFYIQLILEGKPYQNPKYPVGTEEVGLDLGPSTIAYVGDTIAELKQFCSELVPDWKRKRRLQRRINRSRRANNPDNYDEKGTVIKGKKGKKHWYKSNRYKKLQSKSAEYEWRLAAYRKSLHGKISNEILAAGCKIKTENISYKTWQKMYGKSIQIRAPSMMLSITRRKAENAHGYLAEISTQTTKLSQTCHVCEEQVKKSLNQRWHDCCGLHVQRDLYSAFLAKCVDVNTNTLDITRARKLWPGLEPVLNEAISRVELRYSQSAIGGNKPPASFGLMRSQSRSHVNQILPINVSDVVACMGESRKEVGVDSGISRL